MNQPSASPAIASKAQEPVATKIRLRGRWLRLSQVGWIALVALALGLFGASLPFSFLHLHMLCMGTGCAADQLTPQMVAALQQMGLSLGGYAMVILAVNLVTALIWLAVAAVIVWRKSDDWMVLLVALMLVLVGGATGTGIFSALSRAEYPFSARLLDFLAGPALFLAFSLFPGGRFTPSWTRWLVLAFLLASIPYEFFPGWLFNLASWSSLLLESFFIGAILGLAIAQIYRYRHVSTLLQRQQTKWIVFGVGGVLVVYIGTGLLGIIFPTLTQPGSLYPLVSQLASTLISGLIPLSIAVSILRYRLWDIDAIINRALIYSLLTGLLGTVYAGLVIGLESLAGVITRQTGQQPVVLVLSTLVIAALFQPLRKGIQVTIDRRFYRRKYDAEKTLAAFSGTLRNEVDLSELRAQLLAVVQETMQPVHVSLWLLQPERRTEEPTHRLEPPGQVPSRPSKD
jgi:hypothetical protein